MIGGSNNMPFTDHFLKEDKSKALLYRKDMAENERIASELVNAGEFDKAEMHAAHFLRLIGELRRMAIDKIQVDQAERDLGQVSDEQMKAIRDWF